MSTLPSGWRRSNIRRVATMKTGHTPSRGVPAYWEDVTIPWFTLADVWQLRDGRQEYLGDTANKISRLGLKNSAAELLPAGTVVLSRTASVGFSGIMPEPMATSQDFWNWICGPDLLPRYLNYQFKSMGSELRALNMGSTHQTIYQKDAASLQILVPPVEEQRAIADFLDRETTQIDALVAKQEEFIVLLRERRMSIRDRVLAAGVHSTNVERSTESPWLPSVPKEWRVVPTRRVLSHGPSNGVSPEAGSVGDLRSLSLSAVRDGRVKTAGSSTKFVDRSSVKDIDALRLRPNDILIVRGNGNPQFVGRAGLAGAEFNDEEYIYPDLLIRVRMNKLMLPRFFVHAFDGRVSRMQIESRARTAVGTFKISAADVRSIVLPLPSLREQQEIASYLDEQMEGVDALIAKAQEHIALAKERRAALITAAVTGQFDVRTAQKVG